MFSAQFGQIANALRSAGLPAEASTKIAAILANGVQAIAVSNPTQVDLTPASMRYVTPDVRRHQLTSLDFRQGDPDYRPYQLEGSEERRRAVPASSVRSEQSPQQTDSTYRVAGGSFMEAKGIGDSVQVGMKVNGYGRMALIDHQSNSFSAKNFRCESDDSGLRFFIEETGTELVWKLMLGDYLAGRGEIEVVTGVALTDVGLTIRKRSVRVLSAGEETTEVIPTSGCQ